MTDFAKVKIVFALAMVGVLFAIHPIINTYGTLGYDFFGFLLKIKYVYFAFISLLGLAVYFYAIDFITESTTVIAQEVGNYLYTISLIVPPLYLILWVATKIAVLISSIDVPFNIDIILQISISMIGGIIAGLFAWLFSRILNIRDKESKLDNLVKQEGDHLQRAEEMLSSQHYDLTVIESFRAIETALRRAIVDSDVHVRSFRVLDLISTATELGIVPKNMVGTIHDIRVERNNAVHSTKLISRDRAESILKSTRDVLNSIRVPLNGNVQENTEETKSND